jgi:hypothetical protein
MKWPPACVDVSLGVEERPLLEDVTSAVKTMTENTNLCVTAICQV